MSKQEEIKKAIESAAPEIVRALLSGRDVIIKLNRDNIAIIKAMEYIKIK